MHIVRSFTSCLHINCINMSIYLFNWFYTLLLNRQVSMTWNWRQTDHDDEVDNRLELLTSCCGSNKHLGTCYEDRHCDQSTSLETQYSYNRCSLVSVHCNCQRSHANEKKQTDRQTDGQTDRKSITIACVTASQSHAKNKLRGILRTSQGLFKDFQGPHLQFSRIIEETQNFTNTVAMWSCCVFKRTGDIIWV